MLRSDLKRLLELKDQPKNVAVNIFLVANDTKRIFLNTNFKQILESC